MYPLPCRVPRQGDGNERVDDEERRRDEPREHEEFCHFLPVDFADDVGGEKDEWERKDRHGNVQAEKEWRDLEPQRIGRKKGRKVDRERDDDFLRVALGQRWHRKTALYGISIPLQRCRGGDSNSQSLARTCF